MQDSQPVAFASKSLTDTESRNTNIEREFLAVVYACERFHTYMYCKPFVVQCDHKPLEMIQLKNLHAAPPRLQRMLLRVKQLHEETARDPVLAPLRDILVSGWPDTERELPKVLKPYWSYRDELSIDDGVILKGSEQVLVPAAMQQYVLTALYAGHQERDKCRLRGKGSVYWNGMAADIEAYVASCSICQQHARSQQKELKDVPPYPWHTLSADFFELEGEEYLLVVDYYSYQML